MFCDTMFDRDVIDSSSWNNAQWNFHRDVLQWVPRNSYSNKKEKELYDTIFV